MASIGPIVVSDESSNNSSSVLVNNPSFYLKRMTSNNCRNNASFFRSAVSDSELDNTGVCIAKITIFKYRACNFIDERERERERK